MFSEIERQIYSPALPDRDFGRFDPLAVKRRLWVVSDGKLNDLLDLYEGGDELKRLAAEEELVRVAREAFGFAGIQHEGGVCDADVLTVLADFLEWLAGKPEPRGGSPTPSPCSEPAG